MSKIIRKRCFVHALLRIFIGTGKNEVGKRKEFRGKSNSRWCRDSFLYAEHNRPYSIHSRNF